MALPPCFPLFDVQCRRCLFRAQVKTAHCKPKDEVFGGGGDVLEKNRKAGHLIPPLIINFHWQETKTRKWHREVHFFPFLTEKNLRYYERSKHGKRPGYLQFNYVGLSEPGIAKTLLPIHARA